MASRQAALPDLGRVLMDPLTVTAGEAARMLGISRSSIYVRANQPDPEGQCWLIDGKVRILRSGQRVLIPRAELEAALQPPPAPLVYEKAVSFT